MSDSSSTSITFTGMLTILFIGLKLTDHIDWSWWLVMSPLLITFIVTFTLTFILGMFKLR